MNKLLLAGLSALIAGVAVVTATAGSGVQVTDLSDRIKRVLVDGRGYLVFRLGDGEYNVMAMGNPAVRLTFGQTGGPTEIGDGPALAQLKADMKRFPKNLFAVPIA